MDRMSSIELALKNEEVEMNFYQNEASRSNNALAKAMFENLAKDEQEHMNRIRDLHQRLQADGSWPEDLPLQVADTNIKNTLNTLVSKKGSAEAHDQNDVQALEKAKKFETKGSQFYADLAAACDNPKEKKFFQFLSRIEREHMLSITDSLAYLSDPDGWMMEQEKSGLDGA